MHPALGQRLERALERYAPEEIRGDKQAFQQALRDRMGSENSRQGTSYPAVLGYFAGKVTPSLPWVLEASALLNVRVSWLAFGEGEPTEDEEREAAFLGTLSTAVAAGPDVVEHEEGVRYWRRAMKVRDGVLRCWASHPGIRVRKEYMPHWVAPLAVACRRLDADPTTAGRALRAPLDILGVDPAAMGNEALNDYILSMVPVLMALGPARRGEEWEEEAHDGGP